MLVKNITYPDRGFRWKAADGRVFRYLLYLVSALFFGARGVAYFVPEMKNVAQNTSVGTFLVGAALIICSRSGMRWTKGEVDDAGNTWVQAAANYWQHRGLVPTPDGQTLYLDHRIVSAHDPYEEHFAFSNGMVGLYYEAFTFTEKPAQTEGKVQCWLTKCLVLQLKDGTEVLRVATRRSGHFDVTQALYFPLGVLADVLNTHGKLALGRMMSESEVALFISGVECGTLETGRLTDCDTLIVSEGEIPNLLRSV